MCKLAWRLDWRDRSIDPLDGLEIGQANGLHGATAQYVDPRLRPETRQLKAMAAAPDKLCGPDGTDPLLDAHDVMARYGWGKTKGYQNLKDRELVPAPVMTHPDRWRLDQLLVWEEKRMVLAGAALKALVAPDLEPTTVTALLPQPKGRRRSA